MKLITLLCLTVAAGFAGGCSKTGNTPETGVVHKHEHHPPHQGTPVGLGDEEYQVEFVRDAATGTLQAFVLDGEMESFIRIEPESFDIAAKVSGQSEALTFKAVANSATGEKVDDTSMFEVQADWLKTATNFDAVIKEVNVRGQTYKNVSFNFPKGNDADASEQK